MRTVGLTLLVLLAFAGNSVLCRAALGDAAIDAASFTILRLVAGAVALSLLCRDSAPSARAALAERNGPSRWGSAIALFVYAAAFSFAYVSLETGTGALILFATVQLTMLGWALVRGERISPMEWLGIALAIGGFVYLMLPGASAPPVLGACLMAIAGIGWGAYTLRGRGSPNPLSDTKSNFVLSLPLAALLALVTIGRHELSGPGVALAITSGALTSGVGYTLWYTAMRGLTTTSAAVVQLAVPVIAAAGGIVFVNESLSARLLVSATLILGGIALVVLAPARRRA